MLWVQVPPGVRSSVPLNVGCGVKVNMFVECLYFRGIVFFSTRFVSRWALLASSLSWLIVYINIFL